MHDTVDTYQEFIETTRKCKLHWLASRRKNSCSNQLVFGNSSMGMRGTWNSIDTHTSQLYNGIACYDTLMGMRGTWNGIDTHTSQLYNGVARYDTLTGMRGTWNSIDTHTSQLDNGVARYDTLM